MGCRWTPRSCGVIKPAPARGWCAPVARGLYDAVDEPVDHGIGRSRGGLSTKIQPACGGLGRPVPVVLTGGNVNDCTVFVQVLAGIRMPRSGRGRPRARPRRVLADKGYSTRAIREYLRRHGIAATIPERIDQRAHRRRRGTAGGRPPVCDRIAYRRRNVVERCFNRLKQYRAIATATIRPPSTTEGCSTSRPSSSGFEGTPYGPPERKPTRLACRPRQRSGRDVQPQDR
ncbi:IS5 family transposase [Nocardia takedensis]|uniref:IS5 family transposase n=1 Tax=Nocardia takedensis TaxID=259390 RepID=UPI003F771962